jgi:SAM-dependent methyltransferase
LFQQEPEKDGMTMLASFKQYLEHLQLEQLLKKVGASDPETLAKTVEHFTVKEGEKRDQIVKNYFGQSGKRRIVDTITRCLLEQPRLPLEGKVLDVGAGTGFFTVRVARKVKAEIPDVSFYAMDLTPAMLLSLAKKKADIVPFVGLAENIRGSIEQTRKHFNIPFKFNAVFSTLMLHHSTSPERVFESIKDALKKHGKAVVVDLCEHSFEEFKAEMGDVHLGFKPENIQAMARRHFADVKVEKLPGIRCESSGRSAEIFIATMKNFP